MDKMDLYNLWLEKAVDDPDLLPELESVKGDEAAITDRFFRELEFGTGGLRGVIGAGTNRMNVYTVRRATQGFADYINKAFPDNPSAAIAYDSRIKSDVFAKAAASVFAANGITAYIFKELMPTPMLSYAVRALKCSAGVVVTASHNPSEYNGYKAYGEDGCQLNLEASEEVLLNVGRVDMFGGVKYMPFDEGLSKGVIKYIGQDIYDAYIGEVAKQGLHPEIVSSGGIKVVYTPLNGAGKKPVHSILKKIGVTDITTVKEQAEPDGNFPTCPFPNPEIKEALALGLELCKTVQPDVLLASDPDADRLGIAVPKSSAGNDKGGEYVLFSGNEVGVMLLEYICSERTAAGSMPKNPVTVRSIVTTELVDAIAKDYGVEVIEVLTGFKFIGEQMSLLQSKGEESRYIFGFEESYGYLAGTYARDKDAIVTAMLVCEMAAFYKSKGISLYQARENMYQKYGVYFHTQKSFTCKGKEGMQQMADIMAMLRKDTPKSIGGLTVTSLGDYMASESVDMNTGGKTKITLPKSDVLKFTLTDNASVVLRPSGTEPKIKAYYNTTGKTKADAEDLEIKISEDFQRILGF